MDAVGLKKGSEGKRYNHYAALLDSGILYNFIWQAVAYQLAPEPAQAERRPKRAARQPPPITTIYGKPLCTTIVVREIVRMHDSGKVKHSHAVNFILADIRGYNIS
jgi:hypothetical protein